MTEPLLIQHERAVLRNLKRYSAKRASRQEQIEASLRSRTEAADEQIETARQQVRARYEQQKAALEREFEQTLARIESQFQQEHSKAKQEYDGARTSTNDRFEAASKKARKDFEVTQWEIGAVYQASKTGITNDFDAVDDQVTAQLRQLDSFVQDASSLLRECRFDIDLDGQSSEVAVPTGTESQVGLEENLETLKAGLEQLQGLRLLKLVRGRRLHLLFGFLALIIGGLLTWQSGWLLGVFGGLGGTLAVGALASIVLRVIARGQVRQLCEPLRQALAAGRVCAKRRREEAGEHRDQEREKARRRRDTDLRKTQDTFRRCRQQLDLQREKRFQEAEAKYPALLERLEQQYEADLAQANAKYPNLLAENEDWFQNASREAEEHYAQQCQENRRWYDSQWTLLVTDWAARTKKIHATVVAIERECLRLFPAWSHDSWDKWQPADIIPPVVRFGDVAVRLESIPHAIPADERFGKSRLTDFALPALAPIPVGSSMLLKASGSGWAFVEETLQAVMLRLLTAVPPGKVRFSIADPVGLGQSFAAFMHLADYDEALVANRIRTDMDDIEQHLGELVAHMEKVIQKYLRNEFQTIEDYNAHAGQLAEPLRILVIAGFPHSFSEVAARRLLSIATSGARCGVFVLVHVDTSQQMPPGFSLADLERRSVVLEGSQGDIVWRDADFGTLPLAVDAPPTPDLVTRILQSVGQRALEAKRVEVPFEVIAPQPEQWWTSESARGIDVALGPTGATRTLRLQLGSGTAQHMLIAGKTGSGKSTLLHVLITNAALLYSPQELELYLVDFKKGVEFKAYAARQLPHARVVAVESEREFGLSVMQRLDAELRMRGQLFREAEVQDLAGYRRVSGQVISRILFIVDEFQEFFVEDDRIAQEANLLLDRLVRQGRAFGIHVLLGSQTLAGAYSLARSTVGQMGVRIALQCSESDATLILNEDNTAASLLARPGDAIYNDAGGRPEGNSPFQVVWLDEEERDRYLGRIHELANERHALPQEPQIVFEGNAPAEPQRNRLLAGLLATDSWPERSSTFNAWLGEAIAIKDPTAAVFRRQSGSNLLIIGQRSDAAAGTLALAMISLAAQHPPEAAANGSAPARFYVLDGSLSDNPYSEYFLGLDGVLPHEIRPISRRDLPMVFGELTEELQRRQEADEGSGQEIYFLVYDLSRLRDLRRDEDDFGFGKSDEAPKPANQFANLIAEGPAFGIHFLVWCDSLSNVNRTFERQTLREFELRLLFQMSGSDSSSLIDSPLASRLGMHRAIFYNEEEGLLEKFRPYGPPEPDWLAQIRDRFAARQDAHAQHSPPGPVAVPPSSGAQTAEHRE